MANNDFLLSVRTALGMLLPRVDADHPYTDRKELAEILERSDLWLTKNAVAGYDQADLVDLDPKTRKELDRNIAAFLEVASKVDPTGPATRDQVTAARAPFLEIAEVARAYTLKEWHGAASRLIDQAAEWAKAKQWPTKRHPWTLTERFLGTYELDRLLYGVMGTQLALIPVGRYTMRARGSFDLAVMPAYESVMVSRGPSGKWMIDHLPGENKTHRWNFDHFVQVSEKLARLG